MDIKFLVSEIEKAGKTKRVGKFKFSYVEDCFVEIAFASKFIMNQMREASREFVTVRGRDQEERLNDDKLREQYAKRIILGWKGLTGRKLVKFMPGITVAAADLEKEIPYDPSIAMALLKFSIEFENFCISISNEIKNFEELDQEKVAEEKDLANL